MAELENWFVALDVLLIENFANVFPYGSLTMFFATLVAIVLVYFMPIIWWTARYLITGKVKEKFDADFANARNEGGRENFRWALVEAYQTYQVSHPELPENLRDLIAQARFPDELPVSEGDSLIAWARRVPQTWPHNEHRRQLWEFCVALFSKLPGSALIPDEFHRRFLDGRKSTAKFWDRWGKQLDQGLLRRGSVARQLKSNEHDIKILAFIEPALALRLDWDEGWGKDGLFKLGRDFATIGERSRAEWFLRNIWGRIARKPS